MRITLGNGGSSIFKDQIVLFYETFIDDFRTTCTH